MAGSRIARGGLRSLIFRVLAAGSDFLIVVVTARGFGADGRGLTRLQRADQAMRAILCDERGEQTAHPARCASHNQVGHRASPYPSASARARRLGGAD